MSCFLTHGVQWLVWHKVIALRIISAVIDRLYTVSQKKTRHQTCLVFLTHGVESFIQLESIDSVNLGRPHLDHISQDIH